MLARSLKASMQAGYDRSSPGLRLTTVTCVLAANEKSASCSAHFTLSAQRLIGVFKVHAAINCATGGVHTTTLSLSCGDASTGARVVC